jgi:ABC-2 type transport system ATP-binding protein
VVGGHVSGEVTFDAAQRRFSGAAPGGAGRLSALVRDLDAASIEITDLQLRRPSLDDVFLTLTGHEAEQEVREEQAGRRGWGRR